MQASNRQFKKHSVRLKTDTQSIPAYLGIRFRRLTRITPQVRLTDTKISLNHLVLTPTLNGYETNPTTIWKSTEDEIWRISIFPLFIMTTDTQQIKKCLQAATMLLIDSKFAHGNPSLFSSSIFLRGACLRGLTLRVLQA